VLKQKARDYTRLSPKEQVAFQDRLIQAVDEGAIPFLLMRVQAGTAHDAGHAIKRLKTMLEQDAQWRGIIGTDVKGLAKMAADQRRYAAGNCEEAVAKTPAATKEGKIQIGLTTCSRTNSRLTGAQDWFGKKHPKERCGTIGGRHAKASIPVATARGAQRVPVALTKGRP
jgi:hypothetical protein